MMFEYSCLEKVGRRPFSNDPVFNVRLFGEILHRADRGDRLFGRVHADEVGDVDGEDAEGEEPPESRHDASSYRTDDGNKESKLIHWCITTADIGLAFRDLKDLYAGL